MAPRTVFATLNDGFQFLSLFDQSLADMGSLGVTPCTATGTNVIALTPAANAFAPSPSLSNNRLYSFIAANTSTGSVTVQLQGLSAVPLYASDGATQVGANEIVAGTFYVIAANTAGSGMVMLTGEGSAAIAPFYPVVNPSSGNIQGSGTPIKHGLVWADSNPVFSADVLEINSVDPSAINNITVTGTPANGTLGLTFVFGVNTVNLSIAVTNAMTTTQVAAAIVAAIQANATLFNPISTLNTLGGGYANGCLVGFINNTANVVAYDSNCTLSATISYTAGTTALTLTFASGQNSPSTPYSLQTALDNNPVISVSRNPGVAPAASSILFGLQVNGSQSSSPTQISVDYGIIELQVLSSTSSSISSRWSLTTPNSSGVFNGNGVLIGSGLYTPNTTDKGQDTIDAKQLWVSGTEEILLSSGNFAFVSGSGHGIQFVPNTGIVQIAQSGTSSGLNIFGDTAQIQELQWQDAGGIRWQAYKPASSTDLRFNDNTADRVILKNGGEVDIKYGPLAVGKTSASFSAWTTNGTRYANPAVSYTDTTSTGTVTTAYTDLFGASTINASTATTYSAYYGSYFQAPVAGTNVTITKGYALGADSFATTSATITGGTIDGSAIGGSTPAAATVTTLVGGTSVLITGQGGVGYAAGSGGAVTQTSNKATAVTLNKISGEITMNNAALSAASIVSFSMTNTSIAATDILALNHVSGGTPGSYTLNAQAASGGATINVRNNTAGTLSEAIVLGFVVIKGAIT